MEQDPTEEIWAQLKAATKIMVSIEQSTRINSVVYEVLTAILQYSFFFLAAVLS